MRTHYDEEVLGEAADRLYTCARWSRIIWTIPAVVFLLTGLFLALSAVFSEYNQYAGQYAGLPMFSGWFTGLLCYLVGNAIAFTFRLRAQIVLATVQSERNTRRTAMLSELAPAEAKKASGATLTAADLPPYPQPAASVKAPLFDISVLLDRFFRFWALSGIFSIILLAVAYVTSSGLIGLVLAAVATGAGFWYLMLREQGVADPLAQMREVTSNVVGNATDTIRTQAQNMSAPREQPPAPPPPTVQGSIFCSNCGTTLPSDASFCGECGTKVGRD